MMRVWNNFMTVDDFVIL